MRNFLPDDSLCKLMGAKVAKRFHLAAKENKIDYLKVIWVKLL